MRKALGGPSHVRIAVRDTCETKANSGRWKPVSGDPCQWAFIGKDRLEWWSWGDLNPRPQAFFGQIYMFSGLF